MAEKSSNSTEQNQTLSQSVKDSNKKNGFLYGLLVFMTALTVMLLILGSVFYFFIHNNMYGLAERYRQNLQGIPLLRLALPSVPDPEDPKYLTEEQLKDKYNQLRSLRDSLQKQLEEANSTISELQEIKEENEQLSAENESIKKLMEDQNVKLEAEKKQIEEDRAKLAKLAADGDTEGFKAFYEKLDEKSASEIYAQIMQEEKLDADTAKFIQIYEKMDAGAAAAIFEKLSGTDMDLVVDILKNMKKDISAEILSQMNTDIAAKLTSKLSEALVKGETSDGQTAGTNN